MSVCASQPLVSAPDARAYFLFDGKKKVAKEKTTLGYAVGCADFPALLKGPGGCGTRGYAPQTVLADYPRPFSVARRSTWGPGEASQFHLLRSTDKTDQFSAAFGLPLPVRGAEQRRWAGCSRLALSEPRSGEFSQPPGPPSSARDRAQPGADPGSPFLWLLSFGEAKESWVARQARKTAVDTAQPAK